MSIADASYEPSAFEGALSVALGESHEREKKLRDTLLAIAKACDNRQQLSAEEVIGEIAERCAEALKQ